MQVTPSITPEIAPPPVTVVSPMVSPNTKLPSASTALADGSENEYQQSLSDSTRAQVLSTYFGVDSSMLESVQALFDEPIIAVIAGSFCRECRGYHEAQKEHAALPKVRERQPHASQQLKLDNIARREATISQWLASACKIAAARGHGTIATQKKGLVDMLDISVKLAAEFTVLAPLYTPLRKNYRSLIQKFLPHCIHQPPKHLLWTAVTLMR